MSNEPPGANGHDQDTVVVAAKQRRPSNFWLIVVAALFIIVPFLTWYGTWFGRDLSDEDIAKYLSDEQNPRHIQHALLQVEVKIEHNDAGAKKFYPQIVTAAKSSHAEIRKTAAWVMGQDNKSEEFHRALVDLLKDGEPLVRRNAALQLVRFGDANGRPELRAMLQPFEARTPLTGSIVSLLPRGAPIRSGGLLARIRDASGNVQEFRSPVDGTIISSAFKEGDSVTVGQTVVSLTPDRLTINDALQALAYVGMKDDLPLIQSSAQLDASAETVRQAELTAKAIHDRGQ
jgi:hypothetical protein